MLQNKLALGLTLGLFITGITSCADSEIVQPNNTAPVINLISPSDAAGNLSYQRGETVEVRGTIEDDGELQSYFVSMNGPGELNLDPDLDENNVNSPVVSINQDILIPADAPTGYYELIILGTDNKGNTTKRVLIAQVR